MSRMLKYEIMILLTEKFNESQLKNWALNFAKKLQTLNAFEISVISRGKRDLAYPIKNQKKGNFIQINFLSVPKYINLFSNQLKFDNNILRFLIINKKL